MAGGPNVRYPNGTEPLCEAKAATIKRLLFLNNYTYAQAYKQFQQFCKQLGIRSKAGTDKNVWDQILVHFVTKNTDINFAMNVQPGTQQELENRKTVLNTFCRKSLKHLRKDILAGPGPDPVGYPHVRALQPPPGPQLVVGHPHAFPHFANPQPTTKNGNQAKLESAYGLGALAHEHGIPIDPVLLAYDASMRRRTMESGEVRECNRVTGMGGTDKMDIEEEM